MKKVPVSSSSDLVKRNKQPEPKPLQRGTFARTATANATSLRQQKISQDRIVLKTRPLLSPPSAPKPCKTPTSLSPPIKQKHKDPTAPFMRTTTAPVKKPIAAKNAFARVQTRTSLLKNVDAIQPADSSDTGLESEITDFMICLLVKETLGTLRRGAQMLRSLKETLQARRIKPMALLPVQEFAGDDSQDPVLLAVKAELLGSITQACSVPQGPQHSVSPADRVPPPPFRYYKIGTR